jgi:hypothetical protein
VAELPEDIQLKFDGEAIKRLDGAPADAVVSSLNALQRMVLIIGMRSEGRVLGQRLKPTAKVAREYSVICRAPQEGSHVQPFNIASRSGLFTPAAAVARDKLLKTLKALDSGEEEVLQRTIPNARERWFMANAASGLLPPKDSGFEITVRPGSHGPFSFKAARARPLIERFCSGDPPAAEEEEFVGKLWAIDYGQTIFTIRPSGRRSVRVGYPLKIEPWLQANVRRRVILVGDPKINRAGDIVAFEAVKTLAELEPTLAPIDTFESGGTVIRATRPLPIPMTLEWDDRIFTFKDQVLGIDVYAESYDALRLSVLEELDVLWRNYALAPERDLDNDAMAVKAALLNRFKVAKP